MYNTGPEYSSLLRPGVHTLLTTCPGAICASRHLADKDDDHPAWPSLITFDCTFSDGLQLGCVKPPPARTSKLPNDNSTCSKPRPA